MWDLTMLGDLFIEINVLCNLVCIHLHLTQEGCNIYCQGLIEMPHEKYVIIDLESAGTTKV